MSQPTSCGRREERKWLRHAVHQFHLGSLTLACERHKMWLPYFRAIREANVVSDAVDGANLTADQKEAYRAEARFTRAVAYYRLYNYFGPVPIGNSNNDPLSVPRPTEEVMRKFISH